MVSVPKVSTNCGVQPGSRGAQGELLVDGEVARWVGDGAVGHEVVAPGWALTGPDGVVVSGKRRRRASET